MDESTANLFKSAMWVIAISSALPMAWAIFVRKTHVEPNTIVRTPFGPRLYSDGFFLNGAIGLGVVLFMQIIYTLIPYL